MMELLQANGARAGVLRRGVLGLTIAAALGCGAAQCLSGCGGTSEAGTSPTTSPSTNHAPNAPVASPAVFPEKLVLATEPWTFTGKVGRTITTPSYRLFTTVDWPWMLDAMPAFLESSLQHYCTALGPLNRPAAAMDTYMMSTRPQWLDLCRSILGPDDRSFEQIQRGGVTLGGRALLYNVGPRDTFSLVAHEGWHQFSQTVLRDPLPVWLEEGIATYMEGYRWNRQRTAAEFQPWRNFERFDALRKASDRNNLISLEELLNTTPQDELARSDERALTYYGQVWALVHFLHEGEGGKYAQGLADALADASRSRLTHQIGSVLGSQAARSHMLRRRGPQVFEAYCTTDLKAASVEYRAFISSVVKTGSGQRISEGRSPLAK